MKKCNQDEGPTELLACCQQLKVFRDMGDAHQIRWSLIVELAHVPARSLLPRPRTTARLGNSDHQG